MEFKRIIPPGSKGPLAMSYASAFMLAYDGIVTGNPLYFALAASFPLIMHGVVYVYYSGDIYGDS